jgi:primosomal protein N''
VSQETQTEEPSPPVEQTKPEDLARQEYEQRVLHNERTGGGKVQQDELQAQRVEHNERTGDASR